MKALNYREINRRYVFFLLFLTLLLSLPVLYYFLFINTSRQQINKIIEKKNQFDFVFKKREQLCAKIDTLNNFLNMLNTGQIYNEVALERTILKLKNDALLEIEVLEVNDPDRYGMFKKLLFDVEKAIDNKKILQQAMTEEEEQKKKLMECIEANKKIKKDIMTNP